MDKPLNLAIAAQEAAAQRLEDASTVVLYEEENTDGEISDAEYQEAAAELSAPYCGCLTCVVREVIDAAWPFLSILAVQQFQEALDDPEVREQVLKLADEFRKQPEVSDD